MGIRKGYFFRRGNAFGVAPVNAAGAPSGHHPRISWKGQKCCGYRGSHTGRVLYRENMMKGSPIVPEEERLELLQNYFYHSSAFEIVNTRLEQISLRLSLAAGKGLSDAVLYANFRQTVANIMKSIVLLPFHIVTQRSAPGWVNSG